MGAGGDPSKQYRVLEARDERGDIGDREPRRGAGGPSRRNEVERRCFECGTHLRGESKVSRPQDRRDVVRPRADGDMAQTQARRWRRYRRLSCLTSLGNPVPARAEGMVETTKRPAAD